MIEIDFDELDQAVNSLVNEILEKVSKNLTFKARGEFKTFAYDQIFKMLSADVPFHIQMSRQLFEEVFRKSAVPVCDHTQPSNALHSSALDDDVLLMVQSLDFTPFVEGECDYSDQQQRFERVKAEMNRCRKALANREDYYLQNLFENNLSIEADEHNSRMFEMYFDQLQNGEYLQNTCPPELKEYVKNMVDQTAIEQNMYSRSLKKALEDRRSVQNKIQNEEHCVRLNKV